MDHFQHLNYEARQRGYRDFHRALRDQDGPELTKVNPYQGNNATDERIHWNEGWEGAEAEHRLDHPVTHVTLKATP